MVINITSFSYFGFYTARELSSLGYLGTLFTNLPASRTSEISSSSICSQPLLVAPYYITSRLKLNKLRELLDWPTIELFDKWVAFKMTKCDIFHSYSSFGRRAHQIAKQRYGALTIVERGSSHIEFQYDIMREEYERWRVPYKGIDARIRDKELHEYNECDKIIVQSSFALRSFIERGINPEKLIKLPLGVDLKVFRFAKKNDSVFRVLYVGTLSLRKGILYLLEAVKSLKLPNFELVVIGGISDEVKDLIKQYESVIRYKGTVPYNQLYNYYSQASVFVLPTVEDGFAKVITEAMACGVPVIATKNCSAEDIYSDGKEGFIVPIRNPKAIAEKILFLYENPEIRNEMGEAARILMESSRGWKDYGEKVAVVFKQALEKKQSTN